MTADPAMDAWNPESYGRFRGLRLRPALDLLAQVGDVPGGDVVDLGCGDGAAAGVLAQRFPTSRVIGVDGSAAMLARARGYAVLQQADIAAWQPDAAPALIFSNAALQWLPDHAVLLPRLARSLRPGGTLAVQMPQQYVAPSHSLLREIAGVQGFVPPVHAAAVYWEMLTGLGLLTMWETTYLQHLPAVAEGHPVRHFTQSTAMLPFMAGLSVIDAAAFVTAYDADLHAAYPLRNDGSVLFPFTRLFLILKV